MSKKIARPIIAVLLASMTASTLASDTVYAADESAPVWRLQMVLATGDISDAGTDDTVSVSLNTANQTRLDFPRDDFQRNNRFTYELPTTGITRLQDIDRFVVGKDGTDGVCLSEIELRVNGVAVFNQKLTSSGNPCKWIDNDDGHPPTHSVTRAEMRANSKWSSAKLPPLPSRITQAHLEALITAMAGNRTVGNALDWGSGRNTFGRAVELKRKDAVTGQVDLDMQYDLPGPYNPEVDVDFELQMQCVGNRLKLQVGAISSHVDSKVTSTVGKVLPDIVSSIADDLTGEYLKSLITNLNAAIPTGATCPRVVFDDNGDLIISR